MSVNVNSRFYNTFKGPTDVVKQTVAKEGLLGLYAGMESTFWR